MLLTRVFRKSGIRLDWGNRQKISVRSYIDSTSIAKMGLRFSDRRGAEPPRKAIIEGERIQKKPTMKESRSHSQETKSRGVRFFDSGDLKRKGEPLLSDFPKQARRSPRGKSVQQKEASQSSRSSQVKHSELERPKTTKSLASILEKEPVRKTEEVEKKKMGVEKRKSQPQKSPRLKKMSARKDASTTVQMTTAEVSENESISAVDTTEANMEAVADNPKDAPSVLDNSVFEEVVPTTFQSSLVCKQSATHVMGQKVTHKVVTVMTNVPSKYITFQRESWKHRLVVTEEKRTKSVVIRDKPKRYVKTFFKSVEFDHSILHRLDRGYKNFFDQPKRVGKEPYPPEPFGERLTSYPILDSTMIKVVPDLQPPNFVELNYEKLKLKVQPEPVVDDMTPDQIAEAVQLINKACEEKRSKSSICVYQDPGTSQTKAIAEDPQGGTIRKGEYRPLLIGKLVCSYIVVQTILHNRPLWEFNSNTEVIPWLGSTFLRLHDSYDLDIPERATFVPPPRLQIIEPLVANVENYATTVPVVKKQVVAKQVVETESSTAAESLTIKKQVQKLDKDMKKIKKMLKKMMKQFGK